MENNLLSIFSIIFAAFSFLLSIITLYFTWVSNQWKITLNDIKISSNRNENNLLFNILFLFKNIWNEDIKIENIKIWTININRNASFELINNDEIVNLINEGNIFNYNVNFTLNIPNDFINLNNVELSNQLPLIVKKQAIFLRIDYNIKRFWIYKSKNYFYQYMLFTWWAWIAHLEKNDFDLIENKIPKDFII